MRKRFIQSILLGAGWLLSISFAVGASAQVLDRSGSSFTIRHEATVSADAATVWATLIVPSRWWSPAHTYSGDAANLTLDARPGGCYCEKLANGGGVQHMQVEALMPPNMLRLVGALGPLQEYGVAGSLTFQLAPDGSGTKITMTYRVSLYAETGTPDWAEPVDQVLGEQMTRLAALWPVAPPPAGSVPKAPVLAPVP